MVGLQNHHSETFCFKNRYPSLDCYFTLFFSFFNLHQSLGGKKSIVPRESCFGNRCCFYCLCDADMSKKNKQTNKRQIVARKAARSLHLSGNVCLMHLEALRLDWGGPEACEGKGSKMLGIQQGHSKHTCLFLFTHSSLTLVLSAAVHNLVFSFLPVRTV